MNASTVSSGLLPNLPPVNHPTSATRRQALGCPPEDKQSGHQEEVGWKVLHDAHVLSSDPSSACGNAPLKEVSRLSRGNFGRERQ